MQPLKHVAVVALIVLPLTVGVYLTLHPLPPRPTTPERPPAAPPVSAKSTEPDRVVSADPLIALNESFRGAYAAGRKETLRQTDPVILVEGDTVVLRRKGKRLAQPYTPPVYHDLKAVAHVPLAVFVLLAPYGDGSLSDDRMAVVRRYRELIPAARAEVAKRGFTGAVLDRQYKLIDESSAFLDDVLARKEAKTTDVATFTRRMGPVVLENATEAARAQIDGLHAQVMAWRKEMTPDEWRRLRVVVMGSHMPREGNLAMQYFTRVLDEPVDDRRLMYAESVWDEEPAMKLVGTSVLDTRIGADFFGDDLRMHRDLLADAAKAYVKQLALPPSP
jgi:hypothetical protein